MKRYTLYILVAILGMLNIQPAEAQQKQDALYVFRNDGKFNAFYYADIERIEYSKVDTLGKEQSDYVVQEIYALDSIFRIPISAIDSVAFVTPETKYKADVTRYDKSISDYIVASDSSTWIRLSTSVPSSLIPKKGDKIVIEDQSKYLPRGIGGIIASVENASDGYTVKMGETGLGDIYDRVTVKFAGSSLGSTSRTRAGIDIEDLKLPTWSENYKIEGSVELLTAFKETASISSDGMGSLSITVKPTVKALRAFLYFDGLSPMTDFYQEIDHEVSINFQLQGGFTTRLEAPLGGYERELPNAKFKATYGPFLELQKSGKFEYDRKFAESSTFSIGYSSGNVSYICESNSLRNDVKCNHIENSFTANSGMFGKIEFELDAVGGVGVTFGASLDLGMGIQNSDPVSKNDILAVELLKTAPLYQQLNKDDLTNFSYYANAQLYCKVTKITLVPFKWNPSYKTFKFGCVPNVTSIGWESDRKLPWRGKLQSKFKSRTMLNPVTYGFYIVETNSDKEEPVPVDIWYSDNGYQDGNISPEHTFSTLDPGKDYIGYTLVQHQGEPIIADKQVDFTLGPPKIDLKERSVELPENDGTRTVELLTTISDLRFESDASWFQATYYKELAEVQIIYDGLPDLDTNTRKGYIVGVGYDREGNELARDTITVTQLRPILQASPNPVTFEQKGGTVKVTLNTTLAQIEAQIQEGGNLDKFFTMTLNADNTITVTAPENTTGQELSGNIIVKGTSPGGQKAELNLNVIQKGDGGEQSQYWLKISPEEYSFDVNGGTARFIVTDNVPDELINDFEWIASTQYSGDKWFATKWDGDDYLFTAEKNTTGKERTAIITFKLKSEKHNVYIEKTVTLTQSTEENTNILSKYDFTLEFSIWGHSEEEGSYSIYLPHINCEISDVTHHSDGTTTIRYEEHTPVRANEFQKIELKVKVDDDGQLVVLSGSAEALRTSFHESYADQGYTIGYYNVTFPQITSKSITSYMIGDNLTTDRDKYSVFFGKDIKLSGSSYEDYHNNATNDFYKHYRVNCSDLTGTLYIVLYKKK